MTDAPGEPAPTPSNLPNTPTSRGRSLPPAPAPHDHERPREPDSSGLATPWSTSLGLTAPIVSAPMGGAAGGRLAAAVSRAGGLGMIGMGSAGSAEAVRRELALLDGVTPYGIGVVDWVARSRPDLFDTVLEASPAPVLVSVGFAEGRFDWVERVHAAGAQAVTQVYDVAGARAAAGAGVDVVVARGAEGGGHGTPTFGTLPLLDAVLEAVDVPVLAAGGISSGRSLAAVLAAGASGAWIGTAFTACEEALTTDAARAAIVAADGTDTADSRVLDAALGLPWPEHIPERVIRTAFTDEWAGREAELAADAEARAYFADAVARDDYSVVPFDAGQGVGFVRTVRPAADIVVELVADARALLARWP